MLASAEAPSPQASGYDPTNWIDRPPFFSYEVTPIGALATKSGYDALAKGLQQRLAAAAGPSGADSSNPAILRTTQFISTEKPRHRGDDVVLYESSGAHRLSNAQRPPLAGKIGITLQREDTMTIAERRTESGPTMPSVVFGTTFVDDRGSEGHIMARVMERPRLRLELPVGGSPRDAIRADPPRYIAVRFRRV